MGYWSQVVDAARRMRTLLLFVALLYIASYLAGWYLIAVRYPAAVRFGEAIVHAVLTERPFTLVTGALRGGNLVQAILLTFLFNLASGAFLSTTLPDVIPLLGAFATIGITLVRGFTIGITYPAVLASSSGAFIVGLGTMLLELGAYVFSGAAGINIALAPIFPARQGVQSRWAAFKAAWRDAARVYVIVVIMLALGAVWEMTGLSLLMRNA
jgi:uncharacterized membrane protein SpoIIM required for sporulation